MPAELTQGHRGIQCEDCHEPWSGAQDSNCVSCHGNDLGNIHWHNDTQFQDNCQSCHQLHTIEYKRESLDCSSCHDNGHGADEFYEGDCSSCHGDVHGDVGFNNDDCLTCHIRPNKIDYRYTHRNSGVEKLSNKDEHSKKGDECLLCHDTRRFDEYNCLSSSCHSVRKLNDEHDEEDENWRDMDCFESGCHSKSENRGGFYNYTDNKSITNEVIEPENQSLRNNQDYLLLIILLLILLLVLGYFHIRKMLRSRS